MSQDEEDDLYNDLFVRTEESVDPEVIQNLKHDIEQLQLEKDNLHKKVTELENANMAIQKENQTLKTNISSLFITAKNELERKTRMIDQMRVDSVGRPRYRSQPESSRHNSPTITNNERNSSSGCEDSQQKVDETVPYQSSSSKNSTNLSKHDIGSHRHDRNRHRYDNDRHHSRHSQYSDRISDNRGHSEFIYDRKYSLNKVQESESRLSDRKTSESKHSSRQSNQSSDTKKSRSRSNESPHRRKAQNEIVKSNTGSPAITSQKSETESTTYTKSDSPSQSRSQSPSSPKNSHQTKPKNCSPKDTKIESITKAQTGKSTNTNVKSNSPSEKENTTKAKQSPTSHNQRVAKPTESQTNDKVNRQPLLQPASTNLSESTNLVSLSEKPSWIVQSQPKPSPKPPAPAQKVVVRGPPNLYNRRLEVRVNKESKKLYQEALDKYLVAMKPPSEKLPCSSEMMSEKSQLKTTGNANSQKKTTPELTTPNGSKVSPKTTSPRVNNALNMSSNTSILSQILQGKRLSPDLSKYSSKVSANNSTSGLSHTNQVTSVLEKTTTTTSPPSANKVICKSLKDKIKEIKQNVHSSPTLSTPIANPVQGTNKKTILLEKTGNKRKDAVPKASTEVSPKGTSQGKARCPGTTTPDPTTTSKMSSYPQSIFEPEVQLHCESSCESNFDDTWDGNTTPKHGAKTSLPKQGAHSTPKTSIKQTTKPDLNSNHGRKTSSSLSRKISNHFPSNKSTLSSVDFIPVYNLETSEKQPARVESKSSSKNKTPISSSPCLKLGEISIKLTSPGKNLSKSAEHSTISSPGKVGGVTKVGAVTDPKSSLGMSPSKSQSLEISPNQNNQNEANCHSPQSSISTAYNDEDSQDVIVTRRKRKFAIFDSEDENSLPASKKLTIVVDKQAKQNTVVSEGDEEEKQDMQGEQVRKGNRKHSTFESFDNESHAASIVNAQKAEDTKVACDIVSNTENVLKDLQSENVVPRVPDQLTSIPPILITPAVINSTSPLKTSETPEISRQQNIETPATLAVTPDSTLNAEENFRMATETTASIKQTQITEDNSVVTNAPNLTETVMSKVNQIYQVPTSTISTETSKQPPETLELSQIFSDQMNTSDIQNSSTLDLNASEILNTTRNSSNDISKRTNENDLTKNSDDTLTEDANVTPQNESLSQQSQLNSSTQSSLNNSTKSCSSSARRENRFSLLSKRRPARVGRVVVKKVIITSPEKNEIIVLSANDSEKNLANAATNDKCDLKNSYGKMDEENKNHGGELQMSNEQNQGVEKQKECDEMAIKIPENVIPLSASDNTTCNTSKEPPKCTQDTEATSLLEANVLPLCENIDVDTISNLVKTLPNALVKTLKEVSNAQIDTNILTKKYPSTFGDSELISTKSDCNVSMDTPAAQKMSTSCLESNCSPTNNTTKMINETSSHANMQSTELLTLTENDNKVKEKPTRERSQRRSSTNDISQPKQRPLQVEKPASEGDESTLDANDIVGRVLRDGTKPVLNLNITKAGDAKPNGSCEVAEKDSDKDNVENQIENKSCTPNKTKEDLQETNSTEKTSEPNQELFTPVRQTLHTETPPKPITPVRQITIPEPACSFQDMDIASDSKWKATNAELKNEMFNYSGKKPKKRISHYVKPSDGTPSPGSKTTASVKRTPDKLKACKTKLSPLKKKLAQAINTSYKVASFRDCISTQPVPKTEKINVLTPRKSPKGVANTPKTSGNLPTTTANTSIPEANCTSQPVTNTPQTGESAKPNKTLLVESQRTNKTRESCGSKKQSFFQRDVQLKLKAIDTPGTGVLLNSVNPMLKPNCVPIPEKMNTPSVTTGRFPSASTVTGRVENKHSTGSNNPTASPRFLIPEVMEENARFVSITSKTSTISSTSTTSCTLEQSTRTSTKHFTSFESNSSSSLSLFTSTLSDVQFRNEHTISPFQDAVRLMNETPFKQLMTGTFSCVSPMAQTPYKSDHTSDVTQDRSTHCEDKMDRIYPDLRTPIKPIITSSCDSETARIQNLQDELALTPDGNSGTSVESGASDPPVNDLRCHVESMGSFQRDAVRPCSSKNNGILAISSCQSAYKLSESVLNPDELLGSTLNKNQTTQQDSVTKTNQNNQTNKDPTDATNQHDRAQIRSSNSENISSQAKTRRNSNLENVPKHDLIILEPKTTHESCTEEKSQINLENSITKTNHQERNVNHDYPIKTARDDPRIHVKEIQNGRKTSNSQLENMSSEARKINLTNDVAQNRGTDRENIKDGKRDQHRNRNNDTNHKQHNSSNDSQCLDSSQNRVPNNNDPMDRNLKNKDPINSRKRRRSSSPGYRDKSRDRSRYYSNRRLREEHHEQKETETSPDRKIRERGRTPPSSKIRKQSRSPNRRLKDKSSSETKARDSIRNQSLSPNKRPKDQSPQRKMSDSSRNRRDRDREQDADASKKYRDNNRPDDRFKDRREWDRSRKRCEYDERSMRYRDGSRERRRKYSEKSSERIKYRESSRGRERRRQYRENSCDRSSTSRQKGETIETPVKKVIVKEILYYTESSIRDRSNHSEDERDREPRQRVKDKEDGRGEREKRAVDNTRRENRDEARSRSRRSGNDFRDNKNETFDSKHDQSREYRSRNDDNKCQDHSKMKTKGNCSKQEATSSRQDYSSSSPVQYNSKKHGTSSEHSRKSDIITTTNGQNEGRVETIERSMHNDSKHNNRPNNNKECSRVSRHNDSNSLNDSIERNRNCEYPDDTKTSSDNKRRSSENRCTRTGRKESNSSANDSSNIIDSSNQMDSSHEDLEPNLNHTDSTRTPKKHLEADSKHVRIESEEDEGLCSSSSNESSDRFTTRV
ncbi:hypothetical protein WDU94_001709 [Cyamophila willieti]